MTNPIAPGTVTGKFQGTPCKGGHLGERYRSTGGCVECAREAACKQDRKRLKA